MITLQGVRGKAGTATTEELERAATAADGPSIDESPPPGGPSVRAGADQQAEAPLDLGFSLDDPPLGDDPEVAELRRLTAVDRARDALFSNCL